MSDDPKVKNIHIQPSLLQAFLQKDLCSKKKKQNRTMNIIACQVRNAYKNWVNPVMLNKNCPNFQQETENQFQARVPNLSSPEQQFGSCQKKCVH